MKHLTLEEKIKIENQEMVLLEDPLTPEERSKIPYMTSEELRKFEKEIVEPRTKEILSRINQ